MKRGVLDMRRKGTRDNEDEEHLEGITRRLTLSVTQKNGRTGPDRDVGPASQSRCLGTLPGLLVSGAG